ncbi:MAG TPA: carboxypeptidase regulatory-like domain-containing protein [Candidatus Sulfopaludibacter sp.]|jgi:DNA-binding beta-propeller fold protein YncE|nr:carboxypeptidase regulatory-like domain-containing protein [Candidatus Sulfopaludibacter sp.]
MRPLILIAALCAVTVGTAFSQNIASIPLGPQPGITLPTDFVINPATNKAYILGDGVEVVDLSTNSVVTSIQLATNLTAPAGSRGQFFVNTFTNRIYLFQGAMFQVIDGATDKVVNTYFLQLPSSTVQMKSYGPIAYNPNTNKFYVGDTSDTAPFGGLTRVLDGDTFATLTTLSGNVVGDAVDIPNRPLQILVNPANNRVYTFYQAPNFWMQVIDSTSDTFIKQATCSATGCTLIYPSGLSNAIINTADNSVWIGTGHQTQSVAGGEDGAFGASGAPFTQFFRLDAETNTLTQMFSVFGMESAMLSIDPANGFIYMMAHYLPTVPGPQANNIVVDANGIMPMFVVLDPNNITPTVANPSPMKRLQVNLSSSNSDCSGYFQPIGMDLAGGNLFWHCEDAARHASMVVTRTTYSLIGDSFFSQFAARIPTGLGRVTSDNIPLFISGGYRFEPNVTPAGNSIFLAGWDDRMISVNPATLTLKTVLLGAHPGGIAVDPGTKRAFVTDQTAGVISIINTNSYQVIATAAVPPAPLIMPGAGADQFILAGPSDPTADPNQVLGAFQFNGATATVSAPLAAAGTAGAAFNSRTDVAYFADRSQWYAVDGVAGSRLYPVSDLTPAGTDTCAMSGITVNAAANQVAVSGTCTAGGKTLAVFNGTSGALLKSINVDAIVTNIGRIIVNPNTNKLYMEAATTASFPYPTVEVFDAGTLAHLNSIFGAAGPFAVNSVTNVVYGAAAGGGTRALEGLIEGQTAGFGYPLIVDAIAVDETTNQIYAAGNSNFVGIDLQTGVVTRQIVGPVMRVFHQDAPNYLVQGLVLTAGLPQTGITTTITGPGTNISAVTGPNGIFAARVPVGTFTVTLSNPAFAYSPVSQTFTVSNIDLTLPTFTATPVFHITGAVATQAGAAVAGVTITATGPNGAATAVTNAAGQYSLPALPAGTYTLTPTAPANLYSPTSQTVQINKADVQAPSFTVNPSLQIVSFQMSSPQIGVGTQVFGTVTVNVVAPKGGIIVTLSSSNTKAAKPPNSVTIPEGALVGSFSFSGSSAGATTITAAYSGPLAVAPVSASNPLTVVATDSVKVTSATWSTSTQILSVTATSTNPQTTLTVINASSNAAIGTMTTQGNGVFTLQIKQATKPSSVNVTSLFGGSAGQGVSTIP